MRVRKIYIRFEPEPKPQPPILGGILLLAGIIVGFASSATLGGLLILMGMAASSIKEGK